MSEAPSDVLARIEALEAELAQMKAHLRGTSPAPSGHNLSLEASEPPASRRDLLRYGAVALGAAAAGLTARPAEAADGQNMVVGTTHTSSGATGIRSNGFNYVAFFSEATNTGGIGEGIYGKSEAQAGIGIWGHATGFNGACTGLRGETSSPLGTAVHGINVSGGTAVRGEIPGTTAGNGIAMYGVNNSSYQGGVPGGGGFGVYGLSAKGHGLVGATAAPGAAAVVGATNGVEGAYAAAFYGPVVVSGALVVLGAKSAALPAADGTHRLVYCVESPESWLEDFGHGTLSCGRAEVTIDPQFAGVADMTDYHVFVTAYDQPDGVTVSGRTERSFIVASKDEAGQGPFSWRLVAKRRDIAGTRLEEITVPIEPTLATVPPMPDPGTARLRSGRQTKA